MKLLILDLLLQIFVVANVAVWSFLYGIHFERARKKS